MLPSIHTRISPSFSSLLLLMLLSVNSLATTPADAADDLLALLKAGNAKEIAKSLNATVELTILTEENMYSKVQAEAILKDFFAKHQPSAVKLVHKIASNPNHRFAVVLLTTNNGIYRLSFAMKNTEGTFLVTEMRIEAAKE
ncbi:DUF4783 domain-containing protein [Hufsiella ginkgonis]|uniref:DUF4783 domain-containing protein n=1 Tax=Hufsiella ginkgonis TaxID=2695274 RepID=A0A7K1XYM1_9SPHI|nr:DUF4783 domain-containing protein [Hufsiella ginkgonis]MXV15839.1 DUF4783 domain-containing protein [Hufsiella ginkgonis]